MKKNSSIKYIIKKYGFKSVLTECKNPIDASTCDPRAPVEYDSGKAFETQGSEAGEWWQVKLNKHYIIPLSYRVKSIDRLKNRTHMKIWHLHASNDNKTWVTIDSRSSSVLNDYHAESIFTLNEVNTTKTPFSYFRIEIVQSHGGTKMRLSISEFDICGIIYGPLICSNRMPKYHSNSIISFIILSIYS